MAERQWSDIQVVVQLGDTVRVGQGTAVLEEEPPRLHLQLDGASPQQVLALDLEETAAGEHGTLIHDGWPGRVAEMPEVIQVTLNTDAGPVQTLGLQVRVRFPMRRPFVRERPLALAFVDPAIGGAVAAAFGAQQAGDPSAIPWTMDSATAYVAKVLGERADIASVEVDGPGLLTVVNQEGSDSRLSLGNVFPTLADASPEEGRERLSRWCAGVFPESEPMARDRLLIRVYPGSTPWTIELQDGEHATFASVPLADDLAAVFVQDLPDAIRPLREEEVAAIVPDPEERLEVACANLLREVGEVAIVGDGPFMLTCGGTYENALPLVPQVWEVLGELVGATPLVVLPARDLFLVHADGAEHLDAMRALVADVGSLAYPISDGLYRLTEPGRLERL